MQALRREILRPSGVEYATSLKLTPSTVPLGESSSLDEPRVLCNLVVARSNLLRIFEVREEPAPVSAQREDEKERRARVRRDTEAFEGEVEMDTQGEGFVNMGAVKVILRNSKLHVVKESLGCNAIFSFVVLEAVQ